MASPPEIDNKRLAKWLSIALAQRKRAALKLEQDYGAESAAVAEANNEIADINTAINLYIKAAAAAPLRK